MRGTGIGVTKDGARETGNSQILAFFYEEPTVEDA